MTRALIPSRVSRLALAPLALALALSGCDSGSDAGGSPGADLPPAPPGDAVVARTVTPSLGLVLNGKIRVLTLDGDELASAFTDHLGSASLDIPAEATGPFLVELSGNAAAQYFDEAREALVDLPEGTVVRAAVADLSGLGTGVTPLTEMAVRYLVEQHGSLAGLTAEQIAAANAFVRDQLAPELDDITLPPTVIGDVSDLAALADGSAADLYALKLAALARVAAANNALSASPALDILDEMADDLADGSLDGLAGALPLAPAHYDLGTFATQFFSLAHSYTGDASLQELLDGLSAYVSPEILALLTPPGGGSGPGDLLSSWAGTYSGSFAQQVTGANNFVTNLVKSSLASTMQLVLGIDDGVCDVSVTDTHVIAGLQAMAYASDFAEEATGAARSFMLSGPLADVPGVSGLLDLIDALPQVSTTLATDGDVPTAFTVSVAISAPVTVNYAGTCTFE